MRWRSPPGGPRRKAVLHAELAAFKAELPADFSQQCLGVLGFLAWQGAHVTILFAFPFVLVLQRAVRHSWLLANSRTDAKTGLPNAAYWRQRAEAVLDRARRGGPTVGVLLVDLDHFKQVNDMHGHLAGDAVLKVVADRLSQAVRPGDVVGRFGGEEFVVLLPGADASSAVDVAERARTVVASACVPWQGSELDVRCSVGVAVALPVSGTSLDELLEDADVALYRAKAEGRNCVRLASFVDASLKAYRTTAIEPSPATVKTSAPPPPLEQG